MGRFIKLGGVDHINACKPVSKEDPSYAETLQLIRAVLRKAEGERASIEAEMEQ